MATLQSSKSLFLSATFVSFLGVALIVRQCRKSCRHSVGAENDNAGSKKYSNDGPDNHISAAPTAPPTSLEESFSLTPNEVELLRSRHFSKSCSVSYANSSYFALLSSVSRPDVQKQHNDSTDDNTDDNTDNEGSNSTTIGPLHIHSGFKSYLIDIHGQAYLDTRNNVAHCGHNHPTIARAISFQVEQLNTNTRYLHPHACLLANKLSQLFPPSSGLEVVFFVNSGSEANDLALRLARARAQSSSLQNQSNVEARPERKQHVIVVDGAYHGHTLATIDVSPYKHDQGVEVTQTPDHVHRVPCPDLYRGVHALRRPSIGHHTQTSSNSNGTDPSAALKYSKDENEAAANYASYVQNVCQELTSNGHSLGAFLIEGGMSVAGVILPPKSYMKKCIQAVREAGGVYIADEVQTGFGRLGKCMWAFQYSNNDDIKSDDIGDHYMIQNDNSNNNEIIPDIVTLGKPFGNGLPLAAVVTTRSIASAFESLQVEYFNTFAGSPVCCAAGLAMLDVLSSENLQNNALVVGTYLMQLFRDLQTRTNGIIGDVRGSGLFLGIELVRDAKTLEAATVETSFVCSILKQKYKVLTSIDGFYDNVIVVKPPMCFTKEDARKFVTCFEKALMEDLPLVKDRLSGMKKTST